eukprot:4002569-Alexandrium_andersonii.AAC.1
MHAALGGAAAAWAANEVNLVEELQRPRTPACRRTSDGQRGRPVRRRVLDDVDDHQPRNQSS